MDIQAFDSFDYHELSVFPTFQFEYIDFLDNEPETFDSNMVCFADFIAENEDKSIYICLNINVSKVLVLEKLLKERNVDVSRKENARVVINLSKTIEKTFLKSIKNKS